MQKVLRKTAGMLCVILMISILCAKGYAAGGSLEIHYEFNGVTFDLYHVATRKHDDTLTATDKFEKYQIDLNTGEFRDIAITLSGYVSRDSIPEDKRAITNLGKCNFRNLESGIYLILGERVCVDGYIHTPIPVMVEVDGFDLSADLKSDQTPEDAPGTISCIAKKVWCGEADHPESAAVQLLKDGQIYDEIILNAENDWYYAWSGLGANHNWQIVEKEVPDGYVVSVIQDGLSFLIINTIDTPVLPPSLDDTMLTVHKVWSDDNSSDRPECVTIHLFRNGKFYDEIELNEFNQWTYTWDRLDTAYIWSVAEAEIPEGYRVFYEKLGNIIYITNIKDSDPSLHPLLPSHPIELNVRKVWVGDDDRLENRPDSVGVTLYDGSTAVETVWLGEWNNWMYSWDNLDSNGDWSVLEVYVPDGYTPSYHVIGNTVTITNTSTLIQTGQLNWPIPVLGSLGAIMVFFGVVIMLKGKNRNA